MNNIFKSYLVIALVLLCSESAVFGTFATADDSYKVNYTQEDVSMQVELTLKLGEHKEFPVSITEENFSLTLIIEVLNNSGPLWGVFIENASALQQAINDRDFQSLFKYADHVSYYSVNLILLSLGTDYEIGFENFVAHAVIPTHFRATILKGIHGKETNVQLTDYTLIRGLAFSSFFILAGISVSVLYFSRKKDKYSTVNKYKNELDSNDKVK